MTSILKRDGCPSRLPGSFYKFYRYGRRSLFNGSRRFSTASSTGNRRLTESSRFASRVRTATIRAYFTRVKRGPWSRLRDHAGNMAAPARPCHPDCHCDLVKRALVDPRIAHAAVVQQTEQSAAARDAGVARRAAGRSGRQACRTRGCRDVATASHGRRSRMTTGPFPTHPTRQFRRRRRVRQGGRGVVARTVADSHLPEAIARRGRGTAAGDEDEANCDDPPAANSSTVHIRGSATTRGGNSRNHSFVYRPSSETIATVARRSFRNRYDRHNFACYDQSAAWPTVWTRTMLWPFDARPMPATSTTWSPARSVPFCTPQCST